MLPASATRQVKDDGTGGLGEGREVRARAVEGGARDDGAGVVTLGEGVGQCAGKHGVNEDNDQEREQKVRHLVRLFNSTVRMLLKGVRARVRVRP